MCQFIILRMSFYAACPITCKHRTEATSRMLHWKILSTWQGVIQCRLKKEPAALRTKVNYCMLTVCSLYAHGMLTVCSRYAHCMLTVCSRYAHGMLTVCSRYAHCMLTVCSRYAHCMLTVCSRYACSSLPGDI